MRRAVEVFGAKLEESQFSVSLTASDYADSLLDAQVLDEIVSFLSQFLILSNSELLIITLWIAHTWAFEASDATPYLAVTSAEMRSGKTRLLEVLELLVRNPWRTERVTPAALYRKIEVDSPTLLLDEWDATVRSDQKFSETLRGILNAGHRRNGKVSVCGSEKVGYTPTDFHVYCPKVIAGIGKLPNTLADRSLQIRLKRKAPTERVERLRIKAVSGPANTLKARLRKWIGTHLQTLKEANPALPDWLSDRQQDGAEPLLAIADVAGGDWPFRARAALKENCSAKETADESLGVTLLCDILCIFSLTGAKDFSSSALVVALLTLEGRPWPALEHLGPITTNVLARLLAPFDIFPRNLRTGNSVLKGYKREFFSDAWNRYLPSLAHREPTATNATTFGSTK